MNVLLVEAEVPTSRCLRWKTSPEFGQTDVVLVLGANVVNWRRRTIRKSPHRRHADPRGLLQSQTVIVNKSARWPAVKAGLDDAEPFIKTMMVLATPERSSVIWSRLSRQTLH
jgi:NAD/NADP transhydrogenase beta subunit